MREVKVVKGFCSRLSHTPFIKYVYNFHGNPFASVRRLAHSKNSVRQSSIMSTTAGEEQWTALLVRETFLDYFKKNGHTFGEINDDLLNQNLRSDADPKIQCLHLLLYRTLIQLYSLLMLA